MDNIHKAKVVSPTIESLENLGQQIRRIARIGIFIFLLLHLYHLILIGLGPEVFARLSLDYQQPLPRLVHIALFACILFYAIDSSRQLILDWQPRLWAYQRTSILIAIVIFILILLPTALLILLDTVLPY